MWFILNIMINYIGYFSLGGGGKRGKGGSIFGPSPHFWGGKVLEAPPNLMESQGAQFFYHLVVFPPFLSSRGFPFFGGGGGGGGGAVEGAPKN